MTLWRARASLVAIFLVSWVANSLVLLLHRHVLESVQRQEVFATLTKIHSMPIGILVGGLFAQARARSVTPRITWAALILSGIWALLIAEPWVSFPSSDFLANNLIDELNARSSDMSFLLAGILGYFTAKAT